MNHETIVVEQRGPAAIVRFARPAKRNAISLRMMREIAQAASMAEDDKAVSALILTGGSKFFSSGVDLAQAGEARGLGDMVKFLRHFRGLNEVLEDLSKPVIAAIEGYCITGGLELALACDIRIAGEGALFGISSTKIGTVAGAGGTQRLPRLIGKARALELLFSAEPIDAQEALRIGLVNKLTAAGQALDAALALAELYAQRAPLSMALTKRAVHRGAQMDLASAVDFEASLVAAIYGTQDKAEGIAAFLEKRKPRFRGV